MIVLEARRRIGGRAWTVHLDGHPADLGCAWLHDAEHNGWAVIAQALQVFHATVPLAAARTISALLLASLALVASAAEPAWTVPATASKVSASADRSLPRSA